MCDRFSIDVFNSIMLDELEGAILPPFSRAFVISFGYPGLSIS
jgi:hypothetical protein